LIERKPSFEEFFHLFLKIGVFQEGPSIPFARKSLYELFERDMYPDDEVFARKKLTIGGGNHDASPAGEDVAPFPLREAREGLGLNRSEGGFAFSLEYFPDPSPFDALNFLVQIQEGSRKSARQHFADAGLSASHEADQGDFPADQQKPPRE